MMRVWRIFVAALCVLVGSVRGQELLGHNESSVREGAPQSFVFQLQDPKTAVRLSVHSAGARSQEPLFVVVRQARGVTSWALPYVESGYAYPSVERTLCPLLNEPPDNQDSSPPTEVKVDFSTSSVAPVNFTITAIALPLEEFYLSTDQPVTLSASPFGPAYIVFEYPPDHDRVRVKLTSEGDSNSICAIASVQNSFCPVVELLDNPDHRGTFQTMKGIAAINTALRAPSNSSSRQQSVFDFFYVVVTVFPSNDECLSPQEGFVDSLITLESAADNYNPIPYSNGGRVKNVTIIIEPALSSSGYAVPIVVVTLVYSSIFFVTLVWIIVFEYLRWQDHWMQEQLQSVPLDDLEGEDPSNQDLELGRQELSIEMEEVDGPGKSKKPSTDSTASQDQPDGLRALLSKRERQTPSPRERSPTSPRERSPTSPRERGPTSPRERGPTSPRERGPTSPRERGSMSPRERGSMKRPGILDILMGRHWDRALDRAGVSPYSPRPRSPSSPLHTRTHTPPLRRRNSESRVTQSLTSASLARMRYAASHATSESLTSASVTRMRYVALHSTSRQLQPRLRPSRSMEGQIGRRVVSPPEESIRSVNSVDHVDLGLGVDSTDFHPGPLQQWGEEGGGKGEDGMMPMDTLREEEEGFPRLRKQQSYDRAMNDPVESEGELEEMEEKLYVNVYLCDPEFEEGDDTQREYNRYVWYLLAVIIFYGIPACQLVVTYQQFLNFSGNQDVCYYNTLCSHPWKISDSTTISAFNNIYSNIGYLILGFLFILLALRRWQIYKSYERVNEQRDPDWWAQGERLGVPQRYGIYYAIGLALMAEAFMSGVYHICPCNANYQFDTTYMYVVAGLGLYKLIENRCPNVVPGPHIILLILACILLLVVVGVLYAGIAFYAIFFFVYMFSTLLISLEIYYRFQLWGRTNIKLWINTIKKNPWPPQHKPKFVMAVFSNVVNLGFALYGIIVRPPDFGSYFLTVMVTNFSLSLFYYWICKMIYGEWPKNRHERYLFLKPIFFFVLALMFWLAGIVFYTQEITNWLESPAVSRNGNEECILLGFFDGHDMWHFLSAFALFFSFLMLMSLDDATEGKPRKELKAF